ncbi:hypothetical protein ACXY7N_26520 [Bacillus toyonensis]
MIPALGETSIDNCFNLTTDVFGEDNKSIRNPRGKGASELNSTTKELVKSL